MLFQAVKRKRSNEVVLSVGSDTGFTTKRLVPSESTIRNDRRTLTPSIKN